MKMGDTKSKTKETGDYLSGIIPSKKYKTTISDGEKRASGSGATSEESQENASKRWKEKKT